MAVATRPAAARGGFGSTSRRDLWWVNPLVTALGLGIFVVYSAWAALQGVHYEWGPYLSPYYGPFFPDWWPFSPALLLIIFPLGFRLSCYYFRKLYYRSYFLDPPACAVRNLTAEGYKGETTFPWILQNVHRYFLYVAVVLVVIHVIDVLKAFSFDGQFGIGLGTLVLAAEAVLLTLFTFSCNSLRHLVGGNVDCFSKATCGALRHKAWSGVSVLNRNHNVWAWTSLFMVGFADLYVRLLSMGVISDVRFF